MKSIFYILLLSSWLIPTVTQAQYMSWEEIDELQVKSWIPDSKANYQGEYHFGFSEGESTLILLFVDNEAIVQIRSGAFTPDGLNFITSYRNLTNVTIDQSGTFYSDQHQGAFVTYFNGKEKLQCLKITNPWGDSVMKEGGYELGFRTGDVEMGKSPSASREVLSEAALKQMTLKELGLLRNEVFARYGYIFRKGGAMEQHFSTMDWYRPQHNDVDSFLTTLEKQNIALIQQIEAEKRQ